MLEDLQKEFDEADRAEAEAAAKAKARADADADAPAAADAESESQPEAPEEPPPDPATEIYRSHPTWINYWPSITLAVLAVAAGVYFWNVNGWILFAGLVFAVGVYGYICLLRSMWLYTATSRRVEVIYGLITKNSNEVRIRDIRAINVKKSGLKGLIGVGTVEFDSAGGEGAEVMFRDVWAPQKVKNLVRQLQDAA